ncbi:uncharacterized protein LOC131027076 isoform X2 [Cryptomeria japonica]|uniref:uncharacterized protein LOC131027076 isoform X2 n=1 Tax=Cryptomeria japonica TaxID=3369 RepID=UPI0027DA6D42|nr:uncharacterized protein LOC131027076 isoform X2 [Cryptomeria japonica]
MCGEESPQLHLLSVLYLFNLYATPFSSLSSFKLSQIIDENLNTNSDKPDFDLQLLVHQIDTLLVDYNNQLRKRNPNREKLASVQANLASASDASNLREQASFFFQTNRYPDGMLRRSTPDKHSSVEWYWKYSLGCSKVFNSGRRWKDLKGLQGYHSFQPDKGARARKRRILDHLQHLPPAKQHRGMSICVRKPKFVCLFPVSRLPNF